MQLRIDSEPLEARIPLEAIADAEQAFTRLQEIFFGENKLGLSVSVAGIYDPLTRYVEMVKSLPDATDAMKVIAAESERILECGNHTDYLKRLATLANSDWFDHRNTLDVWYKRLFTFQSRLGTQSNSTATSIPEVKDLWVNLLLNAKADCASALRVETNIDQQVQIRNALYALETYASLEKHSAALARSRSLRVNKDRSNPENWAKLEEMLRTVFGNDLTEIELFDKWKIWLCDQLKSTFKPVPYATWIETKQENEVWFRLVPVAEHVEIPDDLKCYANYTDFGNILFEMSVDEAFTHTQNVLKLQPSLLDKKEKRLNINCLSGSIPLAPDPIPSRTLDTLPLLSKVDDDWVRANSEFMKDLRWEVESLRAKRFRKRGKKCAVHTDDGLAGIDDGGFGWRKDDSGDVWYYVPWLKRNERKLKAKR